MVSIIRTASIPSFVSNLMVYRIGEKFQEWTDDPLDPNHILESITLYWLTNTFPRSIYFYRQVSSFVGHMPCHSLWTNIDRTFLRLLFLRQMTLVGTLRSPLAIPTFQRSSHPFHALGLKPRGTLSSGDITIRYADCSRIPC